MIELLTDILALSSILDLVEANIQLLRSQLFISVQTSDYLSFLLSFRCTVIQRYDGNFNLLLIFQPMVIQEHHSLYSCTHYLVHSLVGLDPRQLVFTTKKGV